MLLYSNFTPSKLGAATYVYAHASLKSMHLSQYATTAKYLMSGNFRGGFAVASEKDQKNGSAALASF